MIIATLYIRSLPRAIYQRLKERAKRHRRSVTREAAMVLEDTLRKPEPPAEVWRCIDALGEQLRARYETFKDSTLLLREDRRR